MNDTINKSDYISLAEAASHSPYSQEYLSLRARQGKLRAVKVGRNWMTTLGWLEDYLGQVDEAKSQLKEVTVAPTSLGSIVAEDQKHPTGAQFAWELDSPVDPTKGSEARTQDPEAVFASLRQRVDERLQADEPFLALDSHQSTDSQSVDAQLADSEDRLPLFEEVQAISEHKAEPVYVDLGRTVSLHRWAAPADEPTEAVEPSWNRGEIDEQSIYQPATAQQSSGYSENEDKASALLSILQPVAAVAVAVVMMVGIVTLDQPLEISRSIAVGWQTITGSVSDSSNTVLADAATDYATDSYIDSSGGTVAGEFSDEPQLSTNPVVRAFQTIGIGFRALTGK